MNEYQERTAVSGIEEALNEAIQLPKQPNNSKEALTLQSATKQNGYKHTLTSHLQMYTVKRKSRHTSSF